MSISPFTLYNPVRVHFGAGQLVRLNEELPCDARVLVTYGGGSAKRTGVLDGVVEQIGDRCHVLFGGIEPNPHYETLCKALPLIRDHGLNYIVAVGGGSVIDGSKFIAAAALYEGEDPWRILRPQGPEDCVKGALPLGTVLTLSATGSEMNCGAVITRAETQEKYSFHEDACFPRFSIVDPTFGLTLPWRQVANGVVDAFVHVVEQYLTYPVGAMVQDAFSESLLRTLYEIGPRLKEHPQDADLRDNLAMCAMLALNGWVACGVPEDWSTHRIGHELTALFGLDHAVTLALVLPHLLRDQYEGKRDKLAQCGARVFGLSGDTDALAQGCIASMERFMDLMIPNNTLSAHGISLESALEIADRFDTRGWSIGERGSVDGAAVRRILTEASKK